jgi:hypothetical protein
MLTVDDILRIMRERASRESYSAEWEEAKHPRDDEGKFTYKGGRSPAAAYRPYSHPTYLTGAHSATSKAGAKQFDDMGILVTPDTAGYLKHVDHYSTFAIDNGVFGGKFDEQKFRKLLDDVGKIPAGRMSCLFAVAPDVFDRKTMTGDPLATIARSRPWFPEIRARGLPAALVAQDGLEDHPNEIPWDEFDALFIGGGDSFKEGYRDEPPLFSQDKRRKWKAMIDNAKAHGKHVHVGRVNGLRRLLFAYEIGADSVDGTYLAFGPKKNLPKLLEWLDNLRARHGNPHAKPNADDMDSLRRDVALREADGLPPPDDYGTFDDDDTHA